MREKIERFAVRMMRWAEVESSLADQGPFPVQVVRYLRKKGRSASWFPYGFHALAPKGAYALLFAIGGRSDNRAHMPASPDKRPTLRPTEVVLYHPPTQSFVKFFANGDIEIDGKVEVRIKAATNVVIDGADLVSLASDTAMTSTAPSTTIGDGTNDFVALMAEMCQLVHDSQVEHNGAKSMTAATQTAWDTLKAKVLTLS